jgi:tetratricopeptide (TPR) repeat protein
MKPSLIFITLFFCLTALADAPLTMVPVPTTKFSNPKIEAAETHYTKAMTALEQGAYVESMRLWRDYIDHFPSMTGFEQAYYYEALSLYHLGRYSEGVKPLRTLLQTTKNTTLEIEAHLLLIEIWIREGNLNYALAASYEILQDAPAEKRSGLLRIKSAPSLTAAQKVQFLTLRGTIYSKMKQLKLAEKTLLDAKILLDASQIEKEEAKRLGGWWAWRKLQVLETKCLAEHPLPKSMSEKEFLLFSEKYYVCAEPAQELFCAVIESKDEQIRSQSLGAYKTLARYPLRLTNPLPKPARKLKKKEQKKFYEREMRELIEKTVRDNEKSYRTIDRCRANDVF